MKRNVFIASILIMFGLFINVVTPVEGFAESEETQATRPMTRVTPVRYTAELDNGGKADLRFSSINNDVVATKGLLKVRTMSGEKEVFLINIKRVYRELTSGQYKGSNEQVIVHDSNFEVKIYDGDGEKYDYSSNQNVTTVSIINYSPTRVDVTYGLTTGLHLKSSPCVDYNDINFNL